MRTESAVVRRPCVSGYYYPADPGALRQQIAELTHSQDSLVPARAVVVPHGSYRHAGRIIGATLSRIAIPRRCIILGPSHTGSWMPWSVMASGVYRTPLGDVPIDSRCADALRARCAFLEVDAWTQRGEHAIEVVLPFLQQLGPPELAIVPIILGSERPDERLRLAEALAQVVRMQEEPVLLVASSDLSHYEPEAQGAARDRSLIESIRTLDSTALLREIDTRATKMCGAGAVACVLDAARALGAACAVPVAYGTSVAGGGDPGSAIGYAGLIIQ